MVVEIENLLEDVSIEKCNEDVDVMLSKEPSTTATMEALKVEIRDRSGKGLTTPVKIRWKIPSINIKGCWTSDALFDKRIKADWENVFVKSRISVGSPVICLFGHDDKNVSTFSCRDTVSSVHMRACLKEEDNHMYCEVVFFTEPNSGINAYETIIDINNSSLHFSDVLHDTRNLFRKRTVPVPESAFDPVYSTWYSYHQSIDAEQLLEECKMSVKMGYKTIIVDDGWQTMDTNRGYDYTGDWFAERFTEMRKFTDDVHSLGMKVMIWYSVPFCGIKSKAYERFKGKFLTENHRWAPVFDPRYPDVRRYLIDIYINALKEWNLDGFKLDFIDDFRAYPETNLNKVEGQDFTSIDEAVNCLLKEVYESLVAIKPDVLIEFRQAYIGPRIQQYGNMFRAFDCPNDSVTNRLRTTDVRLLLDESAVHSDMLEWHYDEPVEMAALQFLAIIFSVPQISVRLNEIPEAHHQMIKFYTNFWTTNQRVLMHGQFKAFKPLAVYPILSSRSEEQIVFGLYEDVVINIEEDFQRIHIANGKLTENVMIKTKSDWGDYMITAWDCQGNIVSIKNVVLASGYQELEVPVAGILRLEKDPISDQL